MRRVADKPMFELPSESAFIPIDLNVSSDRRIAVLVQDDYVIKPIGCVTHRGRDRIAS
jgi:hypothetical protein